jgi:CHAT domain-containing protein
MHISSQPYQRLLDQLIAAHSNKELDIILSNHDELLTPQLIGWLADQVRTGNASLEWLDFIKDVVTRKLTFQWLYTTDDQQEDFLQQHQDWLLSNTSYNLLIELTESEISIKEYIDYYVIVLVNWAVKSFFSNENSAYQRQLLINAKQLFQHDHIFKEDPLLWATFQTFIGEIFAKLPTGDRSANQELAIQAFEQALNIYTKEAWPVEWALVLHNLGDVYQNRIKGDQSANQELAIQAYQQALSVCTQEAMPIKWANTLNNLGNVYRARIKGDQSANQELAIQAYQQALNVYTKEAWPVEWALVLHNLGNVYQNRIKGDQSANQELAIQAFEQALSVRTQEAMPEDWARTLNNLGAVYQDRIKGDLSANQELAILALEQALIVRTQEDRPLACAMTLNNLSNIYQNRIKGSRSENQEVVIQAYQQLLTIYTQEDRPIDWAMIQNRLGKVYLERIKGDRFTNQELAIQAYQQALSVYTQEVMPEDWAATLNNLGAVYQERDQGDRSVNQELAIQVYQQALSVHTQEAMPIKWAGTINNLGNVYRARIKGNQSANQELAIQAFEQALNVYTKEAWPVEWALTINNLGNVYQDRIEGDRSANQELSIQAFEQALSVRTKEAMPEDWARTFNNLGSAYQERIKGDQSANQELAIQAYQQSMSVYKQEEMPFDWAGLQNNLSNVYRDRIKGNPSENQELAIQSLQLALSVYTQEAMPFDWARTQHNMGIVYQGRINGDFSENQELAIQSLQMALIVFTQKAMPFDWARTQLVLGAVYQNRIKGNPSENQELAIQSLQMALSVYTQEAMPIEWASTLYNLASVYRKRIQGDRHVNQKLAIQASQQVLTVFQPDVLPLRSRKAAFSLGLLFIEVQEWEAARNAFETAHQAAENERQQQNITGRQRLAEETASLYIYLVNVCLQVGDESAAFAYALAAKGRADAERLGGVQSLEQLVTQYPDVADYYKHIRHMQQTLHELSIQLENQANSTSNPQQSDDEESRLKQYNQTYGAIRQIRYQLRQTFDELTFRFPLATSIQYASGLSSEKLIDLARETGATFIEYFQLQEGWVAFVVSPNSTLHCVQLPTGLLPVLEKQFHSSPLESILLSYQGRYPLDEKRTFATFYKNLINPLEEYLPQTGSVVIAPEGILHRIPFGALWKKNPAHRLADQFILAIVPSLSFLHRLVEQRKNRKPVLELSNGRLLSVVYPGNDPTAATYLRFVHKEADAVAEHFAEVKPLHDGDAKPDHLIKVCQQEDFSAIHFGCHGYFNAEAPEYSCLSLNGSLTVQQIVNELRLQNAPLVTLGACQTGLADSTIGGDMTGLAQALFIAGANTVIASLWSVEDESTQELFRHFYRKRAEPGITEAVAMQYAQQQVRQHPEWQDAYYWAAFQPIGLSL